MGSAIMRRGWRGRLTPPKIRRRVCPYNAAVTSPRPARHRGLRSPDAAYTVGVDVGGTWVRVLAQSDTGRRHILSAPARGAAADTLRSAWRRLGLSRSSVRTLVVASRGIWTPRERLAAARPLAGLARRVRVVSDVEVAHLGALGAAPGILLLAGTGSIALGRDSRGRWARAGGLGPLLGDAGSAFAIGRDWLLAAAASGDAATARALAVRPDGVARIAALAPAVLARARRGDRRAGEVVATAQGALAALAAQVARRLRLARPVPVSWAGGLMADARYRAGVWRAARRGGLPVAPSAPRASGLAAAAALAAALGARAPATPPARLRPARGAAARPSTSTRRAR